MARLYVSQDQMDQWTTGGKVGIENDLMTVPVMKRTFRLEGAVRFLKLVGGTDEHSLIGKVKSVIELASVGAEQYGTSVILGDAAYECEEGFIGLPTDSAGTSGSGLLDLGR